MPSTDDVNELMRPIFTNVYNLENFPPQSFHSGTCIYEQQSGNTYIATEAGYTQVSSSDIIEVEIQPDKICEDFKKKLRSYKDPIKKQEYIKKLLILKKELDNLILWG